LAYLAALTGRTANLFLLGQERAELVCADHHVSKYAEPFRCERKTTNFVGFGRASRPHTRTVGDRESRPGVPAPTNQDELKEKTQKHAMVVMTIEQIATIFPRKRRQKQ
jgi:hypothetical protein